MDVAQAITAYQALNAATVESTAAQKASMNAWNKDTKEATDSVKTGLLAVGAGLIVAAGASIKMAADYQSSTERLVTSAGESATAVKDSSGKIVGGIDYVRQGMLDMAGQVGDSASALNSAMYVIESGGQHGAAGLTVLRAAAEGAKTENADLTTVADATTSALQDYHLQASQSADVVSKLVAAVGAGKSTFQDLAGSLHTVLPVASAAHVSLTDILADEASMTVHGMSADQSAQDLAHTIEHLQKTTATQNHELALLGINSQQLSTDLGSKGLSGTLLEISDAIQSRMGPDGKVILDMQTALRGLPPEVQKMGAGVMQGTVSLGDFTKAAKNLNVEQAGLVHQFATLETSTHGLGSAQRSGAQIAQSYSAALAAATGDSTTLNTALMLTGENTSYVQGAIKQVSGATVEAGGHVKGWAEIQSTFNQKLDETRYGAEAAAIGMGERLLPMATQALGYLSAQMPNIEAAGNKLVDVALAVGRIVQAIGPFIPAIATAVGLFVAWRTAMTIGTAIEGVVAMTRAFAISLALVSESEGVAAAAQWALNIAMDANPIGLVVLGIAALVAGIVLLVTHWKQVTAFLGGEWKTVSAAAGHAFSELGTVVHHVVSGVVDWLKGHWMLIVGILGGPIVAAGLFIYAHWAQIKAIFQTGVNAVLGVVRGFAEGVVHFFEWLYDHNYYFKDLVDFIRSAWKTIQSDAVAVWNAITGWLSSAWGAITGVATAVWGALSGWFEWLWNADKAAIMAVWNVVSGWLSGVWNQIASVAGRAWDAVSSVIGDKVHDAWNTITGVLGGLAGWFGNLGKNAYGWGANLIESIGKGIADKAGAIGDAVRQIGGVIADWLGFHSPTRLGPGAEADQWAPAFVAMFAGGLTAGVRPVRAAAAQLAGAMAPAPGGPPGSRGSATASAGGGATYPGVGAPAGGYQINFYLYGCDDPVATSAAVDSRLSRLLTAT